MGRCKVSNTCDGDFSCFEANNRVKVTLEVENPSPKYTNGKKRPEGGKTSGSRFLPDGEKNILEALGLERRHFLPHPPAGVMGSSYDLQAI